MSARFVNVDRLSPMLLPCDLREWVPADHIVHFILDAVEQIPTHHFRLNHRGTGDAQFPPGLMLALLIYCYCTGRFGSRTIEAATYSDVAVRYLCANLHPDHSSICEFRAQNRAAFEAAFVTMLRLAHQLKLTKLGSVSVDGTKIQANASKHAAVSYQRAGELIAQLELEVQELTQRAEQADAQAAPETLDIPAELSRRQTRVEQLRKARQIIEQRAQEKAQAEQPEYEAKVQERAARRERGEVVRGQEPKAPGAIPDAKAQYNFTDPESGIMKAGNGQHFEQAYNAQAAVDQNMLIVGQRLSTAANDKQELAPTVAAIAPVVASEIEAILTDSGFYSEAAVQAVEAKAEGSATVRTVYAAVEKTSHHKTIADLLPQTDPAAPGPEATAKEKMAHRMKTAAGKQLYRLRKQTVEPVFGIIKEVMGFRRFRLRGRVKAALEWTLVCVSYNLKRMFLLKNGMKTS